MNDRKKSRRNDVLLALLSGCASLCLVSCAPTHQTLSAEPSGFLGDYSQLREGKEGEALLVYVNPEADFKKYDKILIDPISIYASKGSDLAGLSKEDQQSLLNYLDAALRKALKEDYAIVGEAGAGVMRLRVAMTETEGSMVVLDTVSSVVPIGAAISGIKRITFGTHTGVGLARVEAEIVDSVTNTRLLAAVDERAGSKYTGRFDKFSKWQDVRDAYDYWAEKIRVRLAELRKR